MSPIRVQRILDVPKHLDGIELVIFDLDDTLYSERDYVRSGFAAVGSAFPEVANAAEKLWAAFEQELPAVDTVLRQEGLLTEDNKKAWLDVYRAHRPSLDLYHGVRDMLTTLRDKGLKLGLITDGRPEGQHAKIDALGIGELVDHTIVTDDLGGPQFRKPCPVAFEKMLKLAKVAPYRAAYVGDNPAKDLQAPEHLGMRAIWFENPGGLYYRACPNP